LVLTYIVDDNKSNFVYDAGIWVLCRQPARIQEMLTHFFGEFCWRRVTQNTRKEWLCNTKMNRKGYVVRLEGMI
jgi:hypothetical protein